MNATLFIYLDRAFISARIHVKIDPFARRIIIRTPVRTAASEVEALTRRLPDRASRFSNISAALEVKALIRSISNRESHASDISAVLLAFRWRAYLALVRSMFDFLGGIFNNFHNLMSHR